MSLVRCVFGPVAGKLIDTDLKVFQVPKYEKNTPINIHENVEGCFEILTYKVHKFYFNHNFVVFYAAPLEVQPEEIYDELWKVYKESK